MAPLELATHGGAVAHHNAVAGGAQLASCCEAQRVPAKNRHLTGEHWHRLRLRLILDLRTHTNELARSKLQLGAP